MKGIPEKNPIILALIKRKRTVASWGFVQPPSQKVRAYVLHSPNIRMSVELLEIMILFINH